jgi:hypothetical protein
MDPTEKKDLNIRIPEHRVRRVLSESYVNNKQTVELFALCDKIKALPNHVIADKISKNLEDFRKANKLPHPDSENLRKQMEDLRKADKSTEEYKKIKAAELEISKTQYRFSATSTIAAAVMAEEAVVRNFQMALLRAKNGRVTLADLLAGQEHMMLDVWPLYRDGENFIAAKSKFENEETKKLHKELLNTAKKEFKGLKSDEQIAQIADNIKFVDADESAADEDDEPNGFLTHKDFLTYISQICKSMIADHVKTLPEIHGAQYSFKIEKELKVILSYICMDTLDNFARAVNAYANESKSKTFGSDDFNRILSIIMAHSNVLKTDHLFKRIALTLDSYEKICKNRKLAASKKIEAGITETEKQLAEKKQQLAEQKKQIRDKIKEQTKLELNPIEAAEKDLAEQKKKEMDKKRAEKEKEKEKEQKK